MALTVLQKLGRLPLSANPSFVPLDDTPSQKVQAMLSQLDAIVAMMNRPLMKRANTTAPTFNGTEQLIIFDGASAFDTNSWWDAVNHRYTPQMAGFYRAVVQVTFTTVPVSANLAIATRKNGTDTAGDSFVHSASGTVTAITLYVDDIIQLNGSTDYIDFTLTATTASTISTSAALTYARVEFEAPVVPSALPASMPQSLNVLSFTE